ncbi:hypothetical protein JKP88DRAFT_249570 [Tribonema minus]|uniref:Uncharacterized protein n=1 Tax=Tribonema minus TaxID=303371 RepID=A0A835YSH6_9STRA|nr:hypothetical protein JKP88DRAFT_249570 [Tribonema minus]
MKLNPPQPQLQLNSTQQLAQRPTVRPSPPPAVPLPSQNITPAPPATEMAITGFLQVVNACAHEGLRSITQRLALRRARLDPAPAPSPGRPGVLRFRDAVPAQVARHCGSSSGGGGDGGSGGGSTLCGSGTGAGAGDSAHVSSSSSSGEGSGTDFKATDSEAVTLHDSPTPLGTPLTGSQVKLATACPECCCSC